MRILVWKCFSQLSPHSSGFITASAAVITAGLGSLLASFSRCHIPAEVWEPFTINIYIFIYDVTTLVSMVSSKWIH